MFNFSSRATEIRLNLRNWIIRNVSRTLSYHLSAYKSLQLDPDLHILHVTNQIVQDNHVIALAVLKNI